MTITTHDGQATVTVADLLAWMRQAIIDDNKAKESAYGAMYDLMGELETATGQPHWNPEED